MSKSEAPSSCRLSAPGKVFILGEYAVLGGFPALVAAVSPRFELRTCAAQDSFSFSKESPLGRLQAWALEREGLPGAASSPRWERLGFEWNDPYQGRGGFGASSAQFLLAHRAWTGSSWSLRGAWDLYRELTRSRDSIFLPSGADLIGQALGGAAFFDPTWKNQPYCLKHASFADRILVFSATHQPGRKVATHAHLQELESSGRFHPESGWLAGLGAAVEEARIAFETNQEELFVSAVESFSTQLQGAALECEAAADDRLALSGLPGVRVAKGAGALQSDAIWVLVAPGQEERVEAEAESRGLELVSRGIGKEPGLRLEEEK